MMGDSCKDVTLMCRYGTERRSIDRTDFVGFNGVLFALLGWDAYGVGYPSVTCICSGGRINFVLCQAFISYTFYSQLSRECISVHCALECNPYMTLWLPFGQSLSTFQIKYISVTFQAQIVRV